MQLAPGWSVIVLLAACSSSPRAVPAAAPPVAPPAAVVDAGAAAVDADGASAFDPCYAGDAHDALASLMSNGTLVDPRVGAPTGPGVRALDLGPLFPAVRRQGYEVLSLMRAVPFQGEAFIALVAPVGAAIVRDRNVPDAALAVLACAHPGGWTVVAPPAPLGGEGLPRLRAHAHFALGGDHHVETVTVLTIAETLESSTAAYVVGRGSDAAPVRSPGGASIGVLAELGPVGERVVQEGTTEYRTLAPLGATGWYPFGAGQVFLRVARERRPLPGGRWSDRVLAVTRATARAGSIAAAEGDDAGPAWVLVGAGEAPAWCGGRTDLRCERLAAGAEGLPEGAVPFTWMAGAWPVGSAVPRDVQAPGARWLYLGTFEGRSAPRDPSGHAPLTAIDVRPVAAAR
ncbi:MAG: hypothetical protein JWM10_3653 [Myxococcaceae bacterium]|nr:hypothetical protein [Myxococcaceae bacterium]